MKNHNNIPPEPAKRFLGWFLREDLIEEVEGDLEEKFRQSLNQTSFTRARITYWYQVINYLRPFAITKLRSTNLNHYAMFKNYFKTGWRNLTRQKLYSGIKIGGLSLGISACLLISLFVIHELSYDKNYPDVDQLYRIIGVYNIKGETIRSVHFPAPLAGVLKEDFPEIQVSGRFLAHELLGSGTRLIRKAGESENFYEDNLIFMDQQLLNLLMPDFIYGNVAQALSDPYTIALSKSKADKYFPGENPVGSILILNNDESKPYKIGGVFQDFPSTSHLQYDILISLKGQEFWPGEQTFWRATNYHTYIKVRPEMDIKELESKLTEDIVKNYMLSSWREGGIVDAEERANQVTIELQPVRDIHLKSVSFRDGLQHGDIRLVWLFGIIAGFILVIACINFVNLSTAKSANRAKEVGIRKVAGSFRLNLINQFVTESVIYSLFSFFLAIILTWILLPYFNDLSAKSLVFPWVEWWFLPLIMAASVFIGIIAGIYPALYLSRFQPIQVLKGSLSRGSRSSRLRSILVVVQFTISIALIIGTFIIYMQMNFILKTDIGFDKEQVLLIKGANIMGQQLPAFKNELLNLSDVKYVSISDYLPVAGSKRNGNAFYKAGRVGIDKSVSAQIWRVDQDYVKTLGMRILEGRDFDPDIASDSQAVIINRSMARELGMDNPIGQEITNHGPNWKIIGLVDDFHFESMIEEIRPLCLVIGNSPDVVSVKVNTSNISQVIGEINSVWKKFASNEVFRYGFLDESYAKMYTNVQRMGRIFSSFAILAVIIASLGLFALSAYMIEQRNKEIIIRLVMGASISAIFSLLTKNYLILILISMLMAIPIAWYMMQKWLEDYAYRIQISWYVFLSAGLLAVFIAILTVSYQSLRAAMMNPADNLRLE